MLADHREQHATPICESFPLSLLLSLSLSGLGIPTIFCVVKPGRKHACLKAEGESYDTSRQWRPTFSTHQGCTGHSCIIFWLSHKMLLLFQTESFSFVFFGGGIYKHLLLLLILTINPVFFTPVSKTSNNVQRLKQQVLWRQSVRCCHSTDLWKMKSLWTGVSNWSQLF